MKRARARAARVMVMMMRVAPRQWRGQGRQGNGGSDKGGG
jgi:hypothetical protein